MLVSFDIDGTLELGDPPGPVTMAMVQRLLVAGWLVGSCSDRTLSFQRGVWASQGIEPGFTVLKHRLEDVRKEFPLEECYHVGDTDVDRMFAERAGFRFVEAVQAEEWILGL